MDSTNPPALRRTAFTSPRSLSARLAPLPSPPSYAGSAQELAVAVEAELNELAQQKQLLRDKQQDRQQDKQQHEEQRQQQVSEELITQGDHVSRAVHG